VDLGKGKRHKAQEFSMQVVADALPVQLILTTTIDALGMARPVASTNQV
jgi:hypothetical protein